jgi:RAB6A-GEF complex partner protein 1
MYWPVGTPRIYAAPSQVDDAQPEAPTRPPLNITVSHDGVPTPGSESQANAATEEVVQSQLIPADAQASSGSSSNLQVNNGLVAPPLTPSTPFSPAVKSVEQFGDDDHRPSQAAGFEPTSPVLLPRREPVLALRIARSGLLFATITATSITVWQTKVGLQLDPVNFKMALLTFLIASLPSSSP